jgi:hypothetical protein
MIPVNCSKKNWIAAPRTYAKPAVSKEVQPNRWFAHSVARQLRREHRLVAPNELLREGAVGAGAGAVRIVFEN